MLLTIFAVFLVVITFPISLFMCIKVCARASVFQRQHLMQGWDAEDYRAQVVQEYERAVIFRLGRIKKGGAQGPGGTLEKGRHNFITRRRRINSIQVCAIQHAIDVIGNLKYQASSSSFPALISALWWTWGKDSFFHLPPLYYWTNIYWTGIIFRTVSFDVPPQEILTKDSVTVAVDAVVYYNIRSQIILNQNAFNTIPSRNPMAAVCNVSDYSKSTKLLASTTLR